MKKRYLLLTCLLLSALTAVLSCGSDNDSEQYTDISPVEMDLTKVPYPKLSDYKFFEGEMKNLQPAFRVIPYDMNSALFTDYAHKKRFVWMPGQKQATYTVDSEIPDFPAGAVLIKNFYYENVLPDNTTKIIETRLMIKKADGWIFANYIWNDEQTEAFLDKNGKSFALSWKQGNRTNNITYTIPAETDCTTCHSLNNKLSPIGVKPQNLFKDFQYADGTENQLLRWKKVGYLNTVHATVAATVNWEDETQSLDARARSYLDINCAHCHRPGGSCQEMPLDLAFNKTTNPINMGVCVEPHDFVSGNQEYIIQAQNSSMSLLTFKMQSNDRAEMMPPVGRSVNHKEALSMLSEWIDSMEQPCP